jgi:hypothetical protein
MHRGHHASSISTPGLWSCALVLIALALLPAATARAVPGDLVASVTLPIAGNGVSVASDCNGPLPNIYYTHGADPTLYITNKAGANLGSRPIRDAAGAPVNIDEMAFDRFSGLIYGVEHNTNPENVWLINPVSGLATFLFTSVTFSVGIFRDGLAYDASDNTLWISADISTTIEHYTVGGGFLGLITPTDAAGVPLGDISGVHVGVGDLLYLGRNGFGQIVQVKKSDGSFISVFASPGGRDEGLECDPISYFPKLVLWSRDYNTPTIDAIELEPGTCACGGATPARKTTWGQVKVLYR